MWHVVIQHTASSLTTHLSHYKEQFILKSIHLMIIILQKLLFAEYDNFNLCISWPLPEYYFSFVVQSQVCVVEFGFPPFQNQTVAMRPLTTVAGIPFMYSWSPLQQNFMVKSTYVVMHTDTHSHTHTHTKREHTLHQGRSMCLSQSLERRRNASVHFIYFQCFFSFILGLLLRFKLNKLARPKLFSSWKCRVGWNSCRCTTSNWLITMTADEGRTGTHNTSIRQ